MEKSSTGPPRNGVRVEYTSFANRAWRRKRQSETRQLWRLIEREQQWRELEVAVREKQEADERLLELASRAASLMIEMIETGDVR